MRKKHGTVRTAVRPSGSVNRDRFTRFGRFPNFSLFFFFFFLTLSQKSLLASLWNPLSITLNPHSLKSQSLSRLCLSLVTVALSQLSPDFFLNPHSLNHSLPRRRRTVAAQPRSLPHSLKVSITLSSLPLSLVAVAAQPRSQLTLSRSSLPLSLVPVAAHSVPRRRCRRWYFNLFFLC